MSRVQDDLIHQYDISIIQDRLKIAAAQAEEQAENIAEQFLEGKHINSVNNEFYFIAGLLCLYILVLNVFATFICSCKQTYLFVLQEI